MRKDGKSTIVLVAKASLLTLVDSRYIRSTFSYSNSPEELFQIAISELANFLNVHAEHGLLSYFMEIGAPRKTGPYGFVETTTKCHFRERP